MAAPVVNSGTPSTGRGAGEALTVLWTTPTDSVFPATGESDAKANRGRASPAPAITRSPITMMLSAAPASSAGGWRLVLAPLGEQRRPSSPKQNHGRQQPTR
jgi:hypothetical protein